MKQIKTQALRLILLLALLSSLFPAAALAVAQNNEPDTHTAMEDNSATQSEQSSMTEGEEAETPASGDSEHLVPNVPDPSATALDGVFSSLGETESVSPEEEPDSANGFSSSLSPLATGYTLYVDSQALDDNAPRAEGAVYQTLNGAVDVAQDGDILVLKNDVALSTYIAVSGNKNLTITSDSNGPHQVSRGGGNSSYLISVTSDSGLILKNIIIDGGNLEGVQAQSCLIITNGSVALGEGVILRNNANTSNAGGLIQGHNPAAHILIDGAELYGGSARSAGAMFVISGASATLKSGSIHDNTASLSSSGSTSMGGALSILLNSSVVMEDSFQIYSNHAVAESGASAFGGAIYLQQGTFEMRGGSIANNSAGTTGSGYGGAIAMNGGNTIMRGGIISGNEARSLGGALYYSGTSANMSHFTMTGGVIQDNRANGDGGALYAQNTNSSTFVTFTTILGGTISGNTAQNPTSAPSDAIFANCIFRLNTEASINGAIFLQGLSSSAPSRSVITLVSATNTAHSYLLSTGITDKENGRILVEPGSFTFEETTYSVDNAEPYLGQFSHNSRWIITGTDGSAYGIPLGSLGLGPQTVSFNLNTPAGATGSPTPSAIPAIEVNPGDVIVQLSGFPNDEPALEGYVFEGWTLDRAGTVPLTQTTQVEQASVVLYAQWSPLKYAIIVQDDGNGTARANASSAAEGEVILLTATPHEGYQFKEWQVINGGITIVDNSFVMPAQEVTVKAIFEKEAPGSLTPADKTPATGDTSNIIPLIFIALGLCSGVILLLVRRRWIRP